jgi:ABC-type Fe3+-siderophore transport system permease subunit
MYQDMSFLTKEVVNIAIIYSGLLSLIISIIAINRSNKYREHGFIITFIMFTYTNSVLTILSIYMFNNSFKDINLIIGLENISNYILAMIIVIVPYIISFICLTFYLIYKIVEMKSDLIIKYISIIDSKITKLLLFDKDNE